MLVKPALLGAISGKMGGLVASHNSGGTYLRRNSVPTNPNTPRQVAIRTAVGELTNRWTNTLSDAQRELWYTYGVNVPRTNRLGDKLPISGIAAYIRANVPRVQAGLTIVDDAPTIYTGGGAPVIAGPMVVDTSSNNIQLSFDPGNNDWLTASASILAYISQPQNVSKKFFGGPFRFAGGESPNSAVAITNLESGIPIVTGSRYFVTVQVTYDDGRLTEKAQYTAIAQA